MEVHRLPRNTAGFERIPNSVINDPNLTLTELGLLVRMLAAGEPFDSVEELSAAFNPAGPDEKAPYGYGRDAYLKAAQGLERTRHVRRRKGKSKGFGKPGKNVTEVSALPFASPDANAQVNTETGSSGSRSDLHEYETRQSQQPEATANEVAHDAANPQVNSDNGTSGSRIDVQERGRQSTAAVSEMALTSGNNENPQVNSETGCSGLRNGHGLTCDDTANPQVDSETGCSGVALLYTDLPPDPPTPADRPASATAEGEGTAAPENPADPRALLAEEAHVILDGLPQERATNEHDRKKVVPLIVNRLELGWPAAVIAKYLTDRELPTKRHSLGGLMVGWLPPQRPYKPSVAPSRPSTTLPLWCGSCGGSDGFLARTDARYRTTDGVPGSPLCDDCHPSKIGIRS